MPDKMHRGEGRAIGTNGGRSESARRRGQTACAAAARVHIGAIPVIEARLHPLLYICIASRSC